MMTKLNASILTVLFVFASFQLGATEPYEYKEDVVDYEDPVYQDPTGVQLKFNDDGSIRAILASGESELQFGDRKDIRQAIKKATMRAKAEIAKFFKESIRSSDTVNEIQKTVSKLDKAGNDTAVRETVETQIEVLENSADAMLSGVVTLKQDVYKEEKYVMVLVGLKEQTIEAAANMRSEVGSGIRDGDSGEQGVKVNENSPGNASSNSKGTESRKSKMYDNF